MRLEALIFYPNLLKRYAMLFKYNLYSLVVFFLGYGSTLWLNFCIASSAVSFETLTSKELLLYLGLTKIYVFSSSYTEISEEKFTDFSLLCAKPRRWLFMLGAMNFGRQMAHRLQYLAIFLASFLLLGFSLQPLFEICVRFVLFLPIFSLFETLYTLLFCCLELAGIRSWTLARLFDKPFQIFGGAYLPLSEFSQFGMRLATCLPFSDLIFQTCYCSIFGHFYQLDLQQWLVRLSLQLVILMGLLSCAYLLARHRHQGS